MESVNQASLIALNEAYYLSQNKYSELINNLHVGCWHSDAQLLYSN